MRGLAGFTAARDRVGDAARRRSRRPEATAALGDEEAPSASKTAAEAAASMELEAALEHLGRPTVPGGGHPLRVIGGLSIATRPPSARARVPSGCRPTAGSTNSLSAA